jgi:hypothetical protein
LGSPVGSPAARLCAAVAAGGDVDDVVAELEDQLLEAVAAKEEAERLAASTQKR